MKLESTPSSYGQDSHQTSLNEITPQLTTQQAQMIGSAFPISTGSHPPPPIFGESQRVNMTPVFSGGFDFNRVQHSTGESSHKDDSGNSLGSDFLRT